MKLIHYKINGQWYIRKKDKNKIEDVHPISAEISGILLETLKWEIETDNENILVLTLDIIK